MISISTAQKVFTPTYAPAEFIAQKGEGSYLYDNKGNAYLDYSCGIGVNNLGHCPPQVSEAIEQQSKKLLHTSNLYWNEPSIQLASRLCELSFADQVFLCNSGTEANEAKLKLARRYFYDQGDPRSEILSFYGSFHGRSMGSLSATGQEKYWKGFEPLVPDFQFAPWNDSRALEQITEKTAGVWIEPVQGEGGVHPIDKEFLNAVKKRCQETGSLLMMDCVQVGMRRTGTLFGYESLEVEPDLMTLAKALGGGMPIGALLTREEIAKSLKLGTHGSTFGGNPVSSAAANAVLDVMTDEAFVADCELRASFLWELLEDQIAPLPVVKEFRGKGWMIGIELHEEVKRFFDELRQKKILVTRILPNILRVLPPLVTSKQEMEYFVSELHNTLQS